MWVRATDVDDLRPACSPGNQRDVPGANAERGSHRGEGGGSSLAVHRAGADADHQSAVVLSAYSRLRRARANSDGYAHTLSLPARGMSAHVVSHARRRSASTAKGSGATIQS
jgi:hypothetical protein